MAAILALATIAFFACFETIKETVIWSYNQRPFTPIERLLTEPRVLVFYLSQIFYPTHHRLSIGHIFPVSDSLIDPWTTLLCLLLIATLIIFSFVQIKKKPFLSFAILFFFLNHIIESSIIGLELVFEHRNYLPSLFIFLPFSVIIYCFMGHAYRNKHSLFLFSNLFMILIMVFMGLITHTRNMDWQSEKTLWEDVLRKYPNSTRAMHNLAHGYYQRKGDFDSALMLYNLILSKDWRDGSADFRKGLALNNMAFIYFLKGIDESALKLWDQALVIHPQLESARIGKTRALISLGRWRDASQSIDEFLSNRQSIVALNLKAFILFKQARYDEAIPFAQKALQTDPLNVESMIYLSAIYSKLGHLSKSRLFLNISRSMKTQDVKILLMLLENSILMEDHQAIKKYVALILNPSLREQVLYALRTSQKEDGIPMRLERIIPQIAIGADSHAKKWVHSIEALIGDSDA